MTLTYNDIGVWFCPETMVKKTEVYSTDGTLLYTMYTLEVV